MAQQAGIIDIDRGYRKVLAGLLELKDAPDLTVGIHDSAGEELVVIALANEFGTAFIPARSFIRTTIDRNRGRYFNVLASIIERVLLEGADITEELGGLGEVVVEDVTRFMIALRSPPNDPDTLEQKSGTNPLVDSGDLLEAVTWKVD